MIKQPPQDSISSAAQTTNTANQSSSQSMPKTPSVPIPNTKRMVALSTILFLFFLVCNAILIFLTNQKNLQINNLKQQIETTRLNNLSLGETLDYFNASQDEIDLITAALPSNETLVEFINQLETIAQESSGNSILEFSALAPSGPQGQKYLPLVIKFDTNLENFENFLNRAEKLPYLFEVTSIQATKTSQQSQSWQFIIAGRVYTREPFEASELSTK